jgi:hypothetical protein
VGVEIQSPNINAARARNLASGDWHTPFVAARANGSGNGAAV